MPVLVQLEAEGEAASGGADAEPQCPQTCGGKGTKSTPRATHTVSFSRLGGVQELGQAGDGFWMAVECSAVIRIPVMACMH